MDSVLDRKLAAKLESQRADMMDYSKAGESVPSMESSSADRLVELWDPLMAHSVAAMMGLIVVEL